MDGGRRCKAIGIDKEEEEEEIISLSEDAPF
jgi:hypothetical protein